MLLPGLGKNDIWTIFFFNHFFGLSRPSLARNEARMMFFFILFFINSFTIFLKFLRKALALFGQKWYWNKRIFFSFSVCPYPVRLGMKPKWCFLKKKKKILKLFFFEFFYECSSPIQAKMIPEQKKSLFSFWFVPAWFG